VKSPPESVARRRRGHDAPSIERFLLSPPLLDGEASPGAVSGDTPEFLSDIGPNCPATRLDYFHSKDTE
jgi:hypothetical protein